ncbi:MAG: glutaredoxin family protein [Anaerolineae bacterium]|nr:glutaredoxin family protein [Anaerolineae bacterium]
MFELVMYSRSTGCPFITVAKRVLNDYGIPFRELYIDQDAAAKSRVLSWTGFLSVPTLVVAQPGQLLPISEPDFLERGRSPRGLDRGTMITEPNADELSRWLLKHGFIAELARD